MTDERPGASVVLQDPFNFLSRGVQPHSFDRMRAGKSRARILCGAATLLLATPLARRARTDNLLTAHSRIDTLRAQQDSAVCLGFRFGRWKPPLDWHAAGQPLTPDSIHGAQAPNGRGWATQRGGSADSTLMLFPAWWPAGVEVSLATRTPAAGDTVVGRATALVANGNMTPPTTEVHAWRVPCRK